MGEPRAKLLLTGATGMLGRALRDRAPDNTEFVLLSRRTLDEAEEVQVSWPISMEELYTQLDDLRISGIIHTATKYNPDTDPAELPSMADASIMLPLFLSNYALSRNLVMVSCTTRFAGTSVLPPLNQYGFFKAVEEHLIQTMGMRGLRSIILEIGDLYGPEARRPRLINDLVSAAKSRREIAIRNPANILFPVHAEDAALAVMSALSLASVASPMFSVIGPEGAVSVRDVATLVTEKAASAPLLLPIEDASEDREIDSRINDYRLRATQLPNWHPRISLVDGISELFLLP